MKILILANFGMGLYRFRKELIEALINNGDEVYVSLPYDDVYVPLLEKLGCKFVDTRVDRRGTNIIKDTLLLFKYIKLIKSIRPNTVLTYTIKPNIYGGLASRLTSTPYLANITGLGTGVENGGVMQKLILRLYKSALKKVDCVFFQNQENIDYFEQKNLLNFKYKLIPGSGVNLNQYKLLKYPSEESIKFLFIARIMKEKGIDQYLEAATVIKQKYSNTEFHIIGMCEEEYESKLLEMKDIVTYHGQQKDIIPFLRDTHCTIHPSYYAEGLSNVLLESAASGRPIITTKKSGCKEVVNKNENGFLVNEKDTHDLIKKVEKFLVLKHSEREKMGVLGRLFIEENFDRDIVVNAYLEEINKKA